jgi:hypothetical protein
MSHPFERLELKRSELNSRYVGMLSVGFAQLYAVLQLAQPRRRSALSAIAGGV